MNATKNPLRQLATAIVNACKQNGLKQSVVLDTLSKDSGFRSVQCGDAAAQNAPSPAANQQEDKFAPLITHLKMILCTEYDDGHAPVDMSHPEFYGRALPVWGCTLFGGLWDAIIDNPLGFCDYLDTVITGFRDVELALQSMYHNDEPRADLLDDKAQPDEKKLEAWTRSLMVPELVRKVTAIELREGAEGYGNADDYFSRATDLVSRMMEELYPVREALSYNLRHSVKIMAKRNEQNAA